MTPNRSSNIAVLSLTYLACLGAAGCRDTGPKNTEYFTQDEVHSIDATLERQSANGARHDAMLRDQHFDEDGRLNALGRSKLNRILAHPGIATVYLPATPDAPSFDARRNAIVAFAKDHGRAETDLKIIDSLNPATLHHAAPDITRLAKTELGSTDDKGAAGSQDSNTSADLGLSGNNAPAAQGSPAKSGG